MQLSENLKQIVKQLQESRLNVFKIYAKITFNHGQIHTHIVTKTPLNNINYTEIVQNKALNLAQFYSEYYKKEYTIVAYNIHETNEERYKRYPLWLRSL